MSIHGIPAYLPRRVKDAAPYKTAAPLKQRN